MSAIGCGATTALGAFRALFVLALPLLVAACGDKVPESETAKQAGAAPRQIVDKASAEAAKALEQAGLRSSGAQEGQ